MRGFEEQLVEVEIGGSLVAERMGGVAETGGAGAGLPPAFVNLQVLAAAHDDEAVLAAGVLLGVAEGARGVAREVRLRAEAGVVVEPVAFDGGVGEAGGLPVQGLLLAVGAVERVEVREELLGDRLGDVPRRVPEQRIESGSCFPEHVGKLQLPMEEPHLAGDPPGDRPRLVRRLREGARQRGVVDLVRRPEPTRAPQVHRLLQRAPRGGSDQLVAVQTRPFGRVVHRHGVHALQHRERLVVGGGGLLQQVRLEQRRPARESASGPASASP